ncbi:MAG: hypothetical protein K2P93_01230 [Alphaproteobacteria bacterium]|nr:hypothetical protein [Alphaproteobacteria bacterium]
MRYFTVFIIAILLTASSITTANAGRMGHGHGRPSIEFNQHKPQSPIIEASEACGSNPHHPCGPG